MNGTNAKHLLAIATVLQLACALAIPGIAALPPRDPVIEAARTAAASYHESLPDYIVRRTTIRYTSARHDFWHTVDTVSGDVVARHGKEMYSNIMRNGKPATQLPVYGAWSTGEFSTALLAILPPERAAVFTHPRAEQLRNRPSFRYDFTVNQPHSAWHLTADNLPGIPEPQNYSPAYAGAIWIDKEGGQVLRIEMSARGLPGGFGLSSAVSRTDFDYFPIGGQNYLLPARSESLTCERNRPVCLKNEIVFDHYDKFVSDTSISFGHTTK